MTDNELNLWLTSPEYLQLVHQVTQLEAYSHVERRGVFPLPFFETREYTDIQEQLNNLSQANERLIWEQVALLTQMDEANQQAGYASGQHGHI